jgi:hypothetical protein
MATRRTTLAGTWKCHVSVHHASNHQLLLHLVVDSLTAPAAAEAAVAGAAAGAVEGMCKHVYCADILIS